YEEDLNHALKKLKQRLNDEQQTYLHHHTSGFEVMFSENEDTPTSHLQQLEQAVAACKSIIILYDKRKGEGPKERQVDPYGLVYRENLWYMVGHCHTRQDLRTFRVDRIQRLTMTDQEFVRP